LANRYKVFCIDVGLRLGNINSDSAAPGLDRSGLSVCEANDHGSLFPVPPTQTGGRI